MKTELRIVFLAKDGKAFLTQEEAMLHENKTKEAKEEEDMTVIELVQKILEDNNWGVYYKSKPLQNLQVQDGVPLLRVNDVGLSIVSQEIDKALNELEERICKTQKHSQKDSQQEQS